MGPLASKSFLQRWQASSWLRIFSGIATLLVAGPLCAAPVPTGTKLPSYPSWWFERAVIRQVAPASESPIWPDNYPATDDFAAANIGQLKQIATQAAAELDAHIPDGAGTDIHNLLAQWSAAPASGVTRDDFAAVNLGQLKAVARLFYDRLIAIHYTSGYPWANQTADDYAIANVGQVKYLFSFDPAYDSDRDGLPNWWEIRAGLNPNDPDDASALTGNTTLTLNGNPITYATAYQQSTDPATAATSDPQHAPPPPKNPAKTLSTINYVPVDISSDFTQDNVTNVALDDAGTAAFTYDHQSVTPFQCRSAVYSHGSAVDVDAVDQWFAGPINQGDGDSYFYRSSIPAVNSSGLMGFILALGPLGNAFMNQAGASSYHSGPPPYNFIVGPNPSQISCGNSGLVSGMIGGYIFEGYGDSGFSWSQETASTLFPYASSPGGLMAGSTGDDTYGVGTYSNYISIGHLRPRAVSDNYLVLGTKTDSTDPKNSVALYNGTSQLLLSSLIPQEYKANIRFPSDPSEAWINVNSDIIVSAEYNDNDDPTQTSKDSWKPCTLLVRNALGFPTAGDQSISFVTIPGSATGVLLHAYFNIDGVFAAIIAKNDSTPNRQAAGLLLPVEVTINKTAETDDDFVAVSNGTDPDLSTELSITLGGGLTDSYTADIAIKGSDGDVKFDPTTVTLVSGMATKVQMWGKSASSAKESSVIQIKIKSGTTVTPVEKKATVFEGAVISFKGKFGAPVMSVPEGWRPGSLYGDAQAVIADDSNDLSSRISFTKGDNGGGVTLRAQSTEPKTTVFQVKAKKPDVVIPDQSLLNTDVWFLTGRFEPGQNTFSSTTGKLTGDPVAQHERILSASLELRGTQSVLGFEPKNDDARIEVTRVRNKALPITADCNASGSALANWMLTYRPDGSIALPGPPAVPASRPLAATKGDTSSIAGFLQEAISRAQATYKHTEYKALKKDAAKDSLGAKGLLGYQEKYGDYKLIFGCTFEHYDGWRLTGEVNDGTFSSPTSTPTP